MLEWANWLLCGATEAERFSVRASVRTFFVWVKKMICSGFGHRDVFENIGSKIGAAVINAAAQGCDVFYTGSLGDFDSLFSSAVRKAKAAYPNIKLICVKPYMTADINENKEYYEYSYDDVIVPDELAGIHFKAAIKARNRWIVDQSDIVIGYSIRDYGGATTAIEYAKKQNKKVILI